MKVKNVLKEGAKSTHRLKKNQVLAFYTIVVIATSALLLPPVTEADADCVSYSASSRTIRVTCDTDFAHVASHVTDETVLKSEGSGVYVLNAHLQVDDGKRLTINSAHASWLKITGAYGITIFGYLDMDGVKVTSWDSAAGSVIEFAGSDPRAYIRWRGGDGGLIQNSEFAYLGYQCGTGCAFKRGVSMETYGGLGTHDVTIRNSVFHHNWYAYYSNSAYNIVLDGNEWHSNHLYNIDPHTGTHDMQITNNHLHSSYGTGIICSLDCYNILIEGNTIHDFTDGNKVGISFSRNMFNSIVRNNEVYNMLSGIYVSESPDNEIYGNNIHDVYRGIYFSNPAVPDDGVTENNHAYDNTITGATYGIMAINSPVNTVTNNAIDSATVSYEYYLATDSKLIIDNQAFNDDRIRAGAGNNTIEISNSGNIAVDGGDAINTDATPYGDTLTGEIIAVDSVDGESEPGPEPDTTAPSVSITEPANNADVLLGALSVTGTASDNEGGSGVKTVQVRVHEWVNGQLGDLYLNYQTATPAGEGDWSTWSIGLDFSEAGSYRIQARATDNAGNQNWHSIIVNAGETMPEPAPADETAPSVQITDPANNANVLLGTLMVSGTASDNEGVKTVQVRVHKWVDGALGDLYKNYETATTTDNWSTWTIDLDFPEVGDFRIQARATDNAGNQAWNSIIVTVSETEAEPEPVDTTAPLVEITEPTNNANVLLGTIMVSGISSDNEGGSGIAKVDVRVNEWVDNSIGDLYLAYQDASPSSPENWDTWSINLEITESGEYRILSRATDNAGNKAWNSIIISVSETEITLDTTPPDVQITLPSTGSSLLAGIVHVEGTTVDNEGIETVQVRVHEWTGTLGDLYLNYQTATATTADWSAWSIDLNMPDAGDYRVQARATDNAGNQDWHAVNVNIG